MKYSALLGMLVAGLMASCTIDRPMQPPPPLGGQPSNQVFITLGFNDSPIMRSWIEGRLAAETEHKMFLEARSWDVATTIVGQRFRREFTTHPPEDVGDLFEHEDRRVQASNGPDPDPTEGLSFNRVNFNQPPAAGDAPFRISTCVEARGANPNFSRPCNPNRTFWRPFNDVIDNNFNCVSGDDGCTFVFGTTFTPELVAEIRVTWDALQPNGDNMVIPVTNVPSCISGTNEPCQGASPRIFPIFKIFAANARPDPLEASGAPDPIPASVVNPTTPTAMMCTESDLRMKASGVFPICTTIIGSGDPSCRRFTFVDVDSIPDDLEMFGTSSGSSPCTELGTCSFVEEACGGMSEPRTLYRCEGTNPFNNQGFVDVVAGMSPPTADTCGFSDLP